MEYYVIGFLVLAAIVFLVDKKTHFIAKLQAKKKWRSVQEEIPCIKKIYSKASAETINTGTIWQLKTDLQKSKGIFLEYIRFCEEKHLEPNGEHTSVNELISKTEITLSEREKWLAVVAEVPRIQELYGKVTSEGKVGKFFDQNVFKQSKKHLEKSRQAYVEYIRFCEEKQLVPNAEHESIDQLIDRTENALLSNSDLLDKELKQACDQYDKIYACLNTSGEELYSKRQTALETLDAVEQLVNSIASKPKAFEVDISEVLVQKDTFHKTIEFAEEQNKSLKSSAIGIGAGAAAGATIATVAPSAALWVATTFGTASTGTAISALSGAAATNAALAWLGGGAVAAGGGGVAAGQALLALAGPIGWGIAGTSVIVSVFFAWRKRKKILESKKDEIVRVKNCTESLQELIGKIDALSLKTDSQTALVLQNVDDSNTLFNADYSSLSEEQKHLLGVMVNNAKGLSVLLNQNVD